MMSHMAGSSDNSWQSLFAADEVQGTTKALQLRFISRSGQPFLILPANPKLAVQALTLYPAQTLRARIARGVLRCALLARLPLMPGRVSLNVGLENPFVHFLQNLAHCSPEELPALGVLAGNPGSPGRRFILMVFNNQQRPVAIVKAGLNDAARELIGREAAFLEFVPHGTAGIPALHARFEHPRLHALALDYFEGESPRAADEKTMPALLGSWLKPHKTIPVALTRTWWELEQVCGAHPLFDALTQRLANRIVHPAIFHGDFVPWNIKARCGAWTVLDWERGDLNGLPGYDWFHFVIQTRILVAKKSTASLIRALTRLLHSAEFQQYAGRAGLLGVEREMALAYLLHHNEVIYPTEGLAQGRELLDALAAQWLKI